MQGETKMERMLPKIFRGYIEYVYQTLSRLHVNFGKQQLNKLKRKTLRSTYFIFVSNYIYIRSNNDYEN